MTIALPKQYVSNSQAVYVKYSGRIERLVNCPRKSAYNQTAKAIFQLYTQLNLKANLKLTSVYYELHQQIDLY